MPEGRTCSKCHTPLPGDAPDGFCPVCSLEGALHFGVSNPEPSPAEYPLTHPAGTLSPSEGARDGVGLPSSQPETRNAEPGTEFPRFGDYELLEEIARGGMGVVFRARQVSLDRIVAVKLILFAQFADEAAVKRFRAEATAAAKLQHPNIVAIHQVSEQAGQPFFSMDYVPGRDLAQFMRQGPIPAREAARLLKTIAEAIHYAHSHGIVHRDLKPSNILIDSLGEPRVTDFGLAKRLNSKLETRNSELTVTGQVLGSPNFIAPEQAAGKTEAIGPHSDVYSLGAILYQLLTSRPPFAADTLTATLNQVLTCDPPAPRLLNPSVPRDLETICLKCLEKEPHKRYATAQALADELSCFLRNEPITARPIGRVEKVWRWSRRNPRVAALSASLAVTLVLVFAAVLWQLQRARVKAEQDRQRLVRLNVAAGVRLMDEGDLIGSLPWFAQALKLDEGHVAAEAIHRLRLGTLLKRCPRLLAVMVHDSAVQHAEFSPDGRWIVSGSRDRTGRVWDALTGEPISPPLQHEAEVTRVSFSPDGRRVLTAGGKQVRIWDATTGQPIIPPLEHARLVAHAAFSPDGKRLVSIASTPFEPGEVHLWDSATGQAIRPPLKMDRPAQHAAFSPDGRLIAVGTGWIDKPGYIHLWDANSGTAVGEPIKPNLPVWRVAFSSDGQRILSAAGNLQLPGAAQVWDAATGRPLTPPMKHPAQVNAAAFSPDGARVVTASYDKTARVWDALTGEPVTPPLKHNAWVTHAAFSPDGRFIVTSSPDLTARVWRADTGEPVGPPLRHWGEVAVAQFSPDGLRLLTAAQDHLVRVWDITATAPAETVLSHPTDHVRCVAFSPDGIHLVMGAANGHCRMWELTSGRQVRVFQQHTGAVHLVRFGPDGRRLLTISLDGTAQLWDPATGQPTAPPLQHSNWVADGTFSPDGQRVATVSVDHTARVWNVADGQPLTPPLLHEGEVCETEFSPDGRQLLTIDEFPGSADRTLHFWDSRTGTALPHQVHHQDAIFTARYSPEGRRIVTGSRDQTARVWDATSWQPLTLPLVHNGVVRIARFSPDGCRVLTASEDNTARLWDAATGKPLTLPMKHAHTILHAEFSRDGRLVLTTSWDTTARVWDAATGEPVTPPLRHRANRVEDGAFSPDGHWVATSGFDSDAHLWTLSRTDRSVAAVVRQAQLLAASGGLEGGEFAPLTGKGMRAIWQAQREKYGADFDISREQALAWHRKEAEAAEKERHWFAALFHLDRLVAAHPADEALGKRRETVAARLNKFGAPPTPNPDLLARIPRRDPRAKPEQLDLTAFFNVAFTVGFLAGTNSDEPTSLALGLQSLAGTEFDVRGVIRLESSAGTNGFPKRIDRIPVGRKCRRLHILHGTRGRELEGIQIGKYVVRYANGSTFDLPLVYGHDVRTLWVDEKLLATPNAVVAWMGQDAADRTRGIVWRLFKSTWNSVLDEEIESIDFVSAMTACGPFLLAITVE